MNQTLTHNSKLIYTLATIYFLTMTVGFLLILQTEFPQIGFDNDLVTIVEAFRESRSSVILSHLLLGVGFFLFFPLARHISDSIGLDNNSIIEGLLNASLALRILPWLGALPLYLFLDAQSLSDLSADSLTWNGLFLLINTLGEDIAVNLLTGIWAIFASIAMWRRSTLMLHRSVAIVGGILGALFVVASGDLIGVDLIQAGNPIATLISPLLRVWIIATAIMLVRQPIVRPISQ